MRLSFDDIDGIGKAFIAMSIDTVAWVSTSMMGFGGFCPQLFECLYHGRSGDRGFLLIQDI